MALDVMNYKGQVYHRGTSADIETARAGSILTVGRLYWETTDGTRVGRAIANNQIRWEISQANIDASVLVETNRALAAEGVLQSAINAEVSRAQSAEGALQSAISAEVSRAQTAEGVLQTNISNETTRALAAETALQAALNTEIADRTADVDAEETARLAAVSALETQLTLLINNTAAALRDERVTDYKGIVYTANESVVLATAVGASPREGIHILQFNSSDTNNTATLTGLPSGGADLSISYNDRVRVVVDGGVITSASLIDDALKAKFNALDASIAALEAATTPTAIRSHFSGSTYVDVVAGVVSAKDVDQFPTLANGTTQSIQLHLAALYNQMSQGAFGAVNGVNKDGSNVELGGALTKTTDVSGAFEMNFTNTLGLGAEFMRFPIFTASGNTRGAKSTGVVEMWFDENADPRFTFIPN